MGYELINKAVYDKKNTIIKLWTCSNDVSPRKYEKSELKVSYPELQVMVRALLSGSWKFTPQVQGDIAGYYYFALRDWTFYNIDKFKDVFQVDPCGAYSLTYHYLKGEEAQEFRDWIVLGVAKVFFWLLTEGNNEVLSMSQLDRVLRVESFVDGWEFNMPLQNVRCHEFFNFEYKLKARQGLYIKSIGVDRFNYASSFRYISSPEAAKEFTLGSILRFGVLQPDAFKGFTAEIISTKN